jgi:hypothetical protein
MDLGGMNLKLHRCHDYRAELTQAVQSFTGEAGHGLEIRSNDVMTEWQLVPRFASHPDTDRWAIIFGDYVHCLRSALDHLVYAFAAASAAPNPPLRQRSVMMPLKTSPGEYKRVLRRLEDLDDITRARIESLQPYDDRPTHKLLWMLEELDVRDKHRLISIVPLYPASMIIRLEGLEPGTTMTGPTPPTRMREGEPFTGWTFDRPAPNLRVDAGAQIHAFVRLDDTPGAPAYELFELADRLFWAARWATDTLLGTHEGGPILPPEPLTGYHVEISEEETNAIKR